MLKDLGQKISAKMTGGSEFYTVKLSSRLLSVPLSFSYTLVVVV